MISKRFLYKKIYDIFILPSFCILILGGCSTSNHSNIHPCGAYGFSVPPTVQIDKYKSVQSRINNNENLVVAIAISGGGERAGNFGAGILWGLESLICPDSPERNALHEVDYLSTVSGGGMAAGAYISSMHTYYCIRGNLEQYSFGSSLKKGPSKKSCKKKYFEKYFKQCQSDYPEQITDPCLRRHLERGYHNNILKFLSMPRVWFSDISRGDLLEDAFTREILAGNWLEENLNSYKDITLGDIFIERSSNEKPRYPYWICNATVFENGAIFPFTPDILECYRVEGYSHRLKPELLRDSFQVPIAVGMAASGAFPIAITPQRLQCNMDPASPYLHLVDGGVSDNLGVITALDLLHQSKEASQKVLIIVDAFTGPFVPYSSKKKPGAVPAYLSNHFSFIPLAGRRGHYRHVLSPLHIKCNDEASSITVVYLSFDDLRRPSIDNNFEEDSNDVRDLWCELTHYDFNITNNAEGFLGSPWEFARNIGTNYNVKAAEQDFLLAVGRFLVDYKRDKIKEALGW